jgi:DNA-binding transcriptional LysR family regulator
MNIEHVDLNLLQVLHLVLTERSVARAARRLHVTPSAVSNSLARLRELLDDPLVTRKGRGIVPTPRAAELAPSIAHALRELDVALFATRFDATTCTRAFTLAVADAGQLTYGPAIAKRMLADLPLAQLRLIGIDSLVSLGDLASSEIDLHVGVRGRGSGLHVEPLLVERTVLIARRNHPAMRKSVSTSRLAALRHIQIDMVPGRGVRDAVADAYKRANVRRDVAMSVPTFTSAVGIVSATNLVATVPESFANVYAARFGVSIVRGPVPRHHVELVLSWHERTHADPASLAFRALVRRAIIASRPA